jgi:DNA-binding SARP family transcriptional activator
MIEIRVLGPLELRAGTHAWTPRGPKIRKLLAVLASRPGQVVDMGTLAEELWDGLPPRTMTATIRTHIYHLRGMLVRESGLPQAGALLSTAPTGYRLRAEPGQFDEVLFDRLASRGRALLEAGKVGEGAGLLREALGLWRGPALADVGCGPVLAGQVARLQEGRLRVTELRIEADLRLGRHREIVAELRGLTAANPLNEWLHGRLIEALERSGRRAEALSAFAKLRRTLDAELGVEPTPELRRLHQEILGTRPAELMAAPS